MVTITNPAAQTTVSYVTVKVIRTPYINVTPATTTLAPGQSLQFTVATEDQFGVAWGSSNPYVWTLLSGGGSLDSTTGLYIADATSSTAVIECTDFMVGSDTATITIAGSAPTISSATATPSTVTSKTTQLAVVATDDGGESKLTYTWSVISQPVGARVPTFSTNATNAAKSAIATFYKAGTYTLRVTTTDLSGQSTVSNVNVTVSQTLTSVIVSPGNFKVTVNTQQQFKAVGYDQFGLTMSAQPTFTWTATTGSINSTGLFTAGRHRQSDCYDHRNQWWQIRYGEYHHQSNRQTASPKQSCRQAK